MLDPSPLLADLGFSPESISVYSVAYGKDEEGNPIRQPGKPVAIYQAVVQREIATLTDANGTDQSIVAFKCMIYSFPRPSITVDTVMAWTDNGLAVHSLVAQGDSISAGPGAWQVMAIETGPDIDGYVGPYNVKP